MKSDESDRLEIKLGKNFEAAAVGKLAVAGLIIVVVALLLGSVLNAF